jgi:hypothetical protein
MLAYNVYAALFETARLAGRPHVCFSTACEIPNRSSFGMKSYTCTDYRQEMILLSLKRQLADAGLDDNEKRRLEEQIRKLEAEMGMN